MALEEALETLGRFGRYQIITYIVCCVAFSMPSIWQLFAIVFIGYINPSRCKLPPNTTVEEAIPVEIGQDGKPHPAQCVMYRNISVDNSTMACPAGYEYQSDGFDINDGTITIEWDLVCDKNGFVELSQTIFNIGVVLGFFLFTPFGDRFGRKKVFFICQVLMIVFGIAMAFSPNFASFCVFQGLTGAFAAGLYVTGMVLACEMFPISLRTTMAPMTVIFGTLAMMSMALWAYALHQWRKLQLGISVAGALFLIYYRWCPESLRWLLANGRVDECARILKTAAKVNGVSLPDRILKDLSKGGGYEVGLGDGKAKGDARFIDYIKSPRPRRYMIVMIYVTLVNNVMFFGLALMMGALSGNVYTNFFLNSFMDVPAAIVAIVAMSRFGRRYPLALFHIFSGVFMAISGGVSVVTAEGFARGTWMLAFALIARFGIGGAYAIEIIYTQEIFPTNLRTTGLGFTGGVGFIGSILSPYSVFLFRLVNWLPCTIFAVLSIIGGFLTFLLPETMGRELPLTVQEVANWPVTLTPEEKQRLKNTSIFKTKPKEANIVGTKKDQQPTANERSSTTEHHLEANVEIDTDLPPNEAGGEKLFVIDLAMKVTSI